MSLQDHGEKTLRKMGLTLSQARIYIALVKLGTHSTVKAVSVFSKVARQDVYRTLTELRDLSLVEIVIGNPAMFRAIPLQETIAILMERKNEKTLALRAEAKELLKLLPKGKEARTHLDNHQFVLIPKKEVISRRIKKTIEAAQESILIITPWRELTQCLFVLHESWKQALNKGVEVQWLIEKQEDPNFLTEITRENKKANLASQWRALIKDPNFKLRTEPSSSKARFGIFDGKEAFISVLSTLNAADSPALWTNNPAIIYILKDYFETKWMLKPDYNLNKLIA